MSLFTNSITVSIMGQFLAIDLLLIVDCIYLFLCVHSDVCLDVRGFRFYLLGAGYFYIPINFLEPLFSDAVKINYLKTV